MRFSFYDRYTNSAFDARPYSITGNEFPKVSNYDERLGGNMGGPLKIPHIYDGSNKTFFFVNFQHDTQKAGISTFSTVPTAAERSGNFCGLGITLYNPFSNLAGPRARLEMAARFQISTRRHPHCLPTFRCRTCRGRPRRTIFCSRPCRTTPTA